MSQFIERRRAEAQALDAQAQALSERAAVHQAAGFETSARHLSAQAFDARRRATNLRKTGRPRRNPPLLTRNIRLPAQLWLELGHCARRKSISVAELIRERVSGA
jgi:hypothetical protein